VIGKWERLRFATMRRADVSSVQCLRRVEWIEARPTSLQFALPAWDTQGAVPPSRFRAIGAVQVYTYNTSAARAALSFVGSFRGSSSIASVQSNKYTRTGPQHAWFPFTSSEDGFNLGNWS
jgi:hypothetical protein